MGGLYDTFQPDERGVYHLPDGIYFNLPEAIYHADDALGSTSIIEIASKPCLWQYNRLRPRKEMEAEYLVWGRAWHCRLLEGKDAFNSRYARPPRPEDFPGCLVTADDVKDFLRQNGQRLTGAKAELVARAKACDDCPPIFDDLLAAWRVEHPDYVELTPRQVQEIEDAVSNMQRDPTLAAVMQAGALIDGAAELSIFYTESGIRRKARFDYGLGPAGARTKSLVIDLKSFTTFKGGSDEEAAISKLYERAYDVQSAWYLRAFRAARRLLAEGLVFGDVPRSGYIENLLGAEAVDWVWVMIRRDAGMIPVVASVGGDDQLFEHADRIIDDTLDVYRSYVDQFGLDQLWTPPPKVPLRLNASMFPTYNRGLSYEQPAAR
ncbi:conserved hypothetical protein [uncultured Pleomorphomonas sp.]|uniref:Uncharacterized protein n=1 Tax=uncultured Pleomorphomonas sp. TaxID=442121 RepID=A0A212LQN9_9HYPH|nr:hypothetical protein [uncultured Pleomorphomonas sp.]SCM79832.1 conserved hypothetical protein [uncultured Pleomorphomonas sp.]